MGSGASRRRRANAHTEEDTERFEQEQLWIERDREWQANEQQRIALVSASRPIVTQAQSARISHRRLGSGNYPPQENEEIPTFTAPDAVNVQAAAILELARKIVNQESILPTANPSRPALSTDNDVSTAVSIQASAIADLTTILVNESESDFSPGDSKNATRPMQSTPLKKEPDYLNSDVDARSGELNRNRGVFASSADSPKKTFSDTAHDTATSVNMPTDSTADGMFLKSQSIAHGAVQNAVSDDMPQNNDKEQSIVGVSSTTRSSSVIEKVLQLLDGEDSAEGNEATRFDTID